LSRGVAPGEWFEKKPHHAVKVTLNRAITNAPLAPELCYELVVATADGYRNLCSVPARGGTEEFGDCCEFDLVDGFKIQGIQEACTFAFVKVLLAAAATEHVTDETLATWMRMAKAYNPKFSLEQPKNAIKAVVADEGMGWQARQDEEAKVEGFAIQYSEPASAKARLQAIMAAGDWAKLPDSSKSYKRKNVKDRRGSGGGGGCVFIVANDDDDEDEDAYK
jgi:hypothetical protein